jgi:hypothetical protein
MRPDDESSKRRMRVVGLHERMCTHDVPGQLSNQQPTPLRYPSDGLTVSKQQYSVMYTVAYTFHVMTF